MNYFLGITILIISTFIGYLLSQKYSERLKFYECFNLFNKKVKNEVSYTQNTIPNIIDTLDKQNKFYYVANNFYVKGEFECCEGYLNDNEKEYLKNYLQLITKGNRTTLIKYLDSADTQISEYLKESRNNYKKYKSLYIKIGFLIGLILLIAVL